MASVEAPPGRHVVDLEPQIPMNPADHAFFLDVDGTLIELAEAPDKVAVEPELIELLRSLALCSRGAVAFVSGRSIAALDTLFHPLLFPMAGLHGFERRTATGEYRRYTLPPGEVLGQCREMLQRVAAQNPGLLLEDKRFRAGAALPTCAVSRIGDRCTG